MRSNLLAAAAVTAAGVLAQAQAQVQVQSSEAPTAAYITAPDLRPLPINLTLAAPPPPALGADALNATSSATNSSSSSTIAGSASSLNSSSSASSSSSGSSSSSSSAAQAVASSSAAPAASPSTAGASAFLPTNERGQLFLTYQSTGQGAERTYDNALYILDPLSGAPYWIGNASAYTAQSPPSSSSNSSSSSTSSTASPPYNLRAQTYIPTAGAPAQQVVTFWSGEVARQGTFGYGTHYVLNSSYALLYAFSLPPSSSASAGGGGNSTSLLAAAGLTSATGSRGFDLNTFELLPPSSTSSGGNSNATALVTYYPQLNGTVDLSAVQGPSSAYVLDGCFAELALPAAGAVQFAWCASRGALVVNGQAVNASASSGANSTSSSGGSSVIPYANSFAQSSAGAASSEADAWDWFHVSERRSAHRCCTNTARFAHTLPSLRYTDLRPSPTRAASIPILKPNSVSKDAAGNYLVSGRNTNAVYYISSNGTLLWQLGGRSSTSTSSSSGPLTFTGNGTQFSWPSSVRFFNESTPAQLAGASSGDQQAAAAAIGAANSNGTRLLSLLDNAAATDVSGAAAGGSQSRGLVIQLNTATRTASIVSAFQAPFGQSGLQAGIGGSFAPAPAENTTLPASSSTGNATAALSATRWLLSYGSSPYVAEYSGATNNATALYHVGASAASPDAAGLVWSSSLQHFRGQPLSAPAVAFRNGSLSVSWNGATAVQAWQLVAPENGDQVALTFNWTSFETRYNLSSAIANLNAPLANGVPMQIVAVDQDARVLGRTNRFFLNGTVTNAGSVQGTATRGNAAAPHASASVPLAALAAALLALGMSLL